VARMNVLIEINRNIASGLMATPEQESLSAPQDPAQGVSSGNIVA